MWITEIFTSIQGEGWNTGHPTTFVRFAGCNIVKECQGCDTPQARALSQGEEIDHVELWRRVPKSVTDVCFTGGEPMLQVGEWLQAARELDRRDHRLTMETNGTIWIPDIARRLFGWIVVSPKRAEVCTLPGLLAADEVKLLFMHPNTFGLGETKEFIRQKRQVLAMNENARICIQPWLAGDPVEDEERINHAVAFCISHDVRLSLQVHKLIGVS